MSTTTEVWIFNLIAQAFPSRPLKYRPRPLATGLYYFLMPLLAAISYFYASERVGSVIERFQVNRHPVLIENVEVLVMRRSKYSTYAQLRYGYGGRDYVVTKFVPKRGSVGESYSMNIYVAGDNPTAVAYRVGWTFLVGEFIWPSFAILVGGWGVILFSVHIVRDGIANMHARKRTVMTPLIVDVAPSTPALFRDRYPYVRRNERVIMGFDYIAAFRKNDGPLFLPIDPVLLEKKELRPALAVQIPRTKIPLLLDRDLARLDLTDEERTRILFAVAKTQTLPSGDTL